MSFWAGFILGALFAVMVLAVVLSIRAEIIRNRRWESYVRAANRGART